MLLQSEYILRLLRLYVSNEATPAEMKELLDLLSDPTREPEYLELYQQVFAEETAGIKLPRFTDKKNSWEELLARIPDLRNAALAQSGVGQRRVHKIHFPRRWGWAAASIILVLGIGAYLWIAHKKNTQPAAVVATIGDIAPGKDGAILTLADGSTVVLDSLGNGVIATQNGADVVLTDGRLAYDPTGNTTGETVYNAMSTPKGRQFNLLLPDGTRVWLNAASSLRYPTVFSGSERRVEVTGEAYFEVSQNARQPFRVSVAGQAEVEVLGTSFNVNAYENEASINTTLIEGSVRVNDVVMKPGQQALIHASDKMQHGVEIVNNADIGKVMAWKNGAFNFNNASLAEVMRQLERWYDIEVVYEQGVPDIHFVGEMSRGVSLAGLIRTLEKTDVHFRIEEGRRLVVMP